VTDSAAKAPEPTLSRLSIYLRSLRHLVKEGVKTVSSAEMARRCGVTAVQIRKDLSYFGEFGRPGIGYDVQHLLARLTEVMNLDRQHRVLIVGAGNLGSALAGYSGFILSPFEVVGIFDNNPGKIGRRLWNLEILDVRRLPEVNRELRANLGMIAVPADAAQEAADLLVRAGVRALLNFAPRFIEVKPDIALRHVDLTRELEVLCYHVDRRPVQEKAAES
jgi:redox-sensing transcriptional repressor